MTEKPEYVLNFPRQKNTEIKKIGNCWYVYERFSKYDPVIKRSRKVSGKCLGKITPDGLVPTRRRLVSVASNALCPKRVSDVVEAGTVLFFWDRTAAMRERLKEFFPDIWETIYVAAVLRAVKEPRFRRLQAQLASLHICSPIYLSMRRAIPNSCRCSDEGAMPFPTSCTKT